MTATAAALYTTANTEYGTRTDVHAYGAAFVVLHFDTDAGLLVGSTGAATLAAAIAKADVISAGDVQPGDFATI